MKSNDDKPASSFMKMVGFFTTTSQCFDCEGWKDRDVKSSNSFNLKMNNNYFRNTPLDSEIN